MERQKNGQKANKPIIIKKYSNRRLYDTEASCYVTLDDLRLMVRGHVEFIVQDAKTGVDLTHTILSQIIFEQEHNGEKIFPQIFPVSLLKQIISMYDDNLKMVLPTYLTEVMNNFMQHQVELRKMQKTYMQNFIPAKVMEESFKQNLNLFENIIKNFVSNQNKPQ